MTDSSLDQFVQDAEKIGVIGSPSSTSELSLDIMAQAVDKKLVGELALFRYTQDSVPHYALGQITEVQMRNIWHEDPTMRSLIRQRGRVDAVSERQDTHLGEMTISAVFAAQGKNYRPSILGTVPPTGTPIVLVDDPILEQLLSPYRQQLFYLGHVYGSKPKLPMWFKHFGSGPQGAGEAYHLGIFGKTGSGKSVLAKMIVLAYARHPQMGILIIDPQGEFAKDMRGQSAGGSFTLPMRRILERQGRQVHVYGVRDLVLDRWELFAQILYESPFFENLSIPHGDNRRLAAEQLTHRLRQKKIALKNLYQREIFDTAWAELKKDSVQSLFYRSKSSRERFNRLLQEADSAQFFQHYWKPLATLFRVDRGKAKRVERLLDQLFASQGAGPAAIVVIDLSRENQSGGGEILWNDTIQSLVIKRVLDGVRNAAEWAYEKGKSLNALILLDEAHRLAPREKPDNEELLSVRQKLIDAVRTTRKYGLGWMFISQTLSSLSPEIIHQLRIMFFGFGLGMGAELRALSDIVGGAKQALGLYTNFRDPHSSFDVSSREYSFMTVGPVSPLSFAGTPLFFNAFNNVKAFLESNHFDIAAR